MCVYRYYGGYRGIAFSFVVMIGRVVFRLGVFRLAVFRVGCFSLDM